MDETFYGPEGSSEKGWLSVLGVAARQGDSGGPITNVQGQWVGTLFGSEDTKENGTYTLGSHIDTIKEVFGQRLRVSPGTNYNFTEQ